MSQPEPAEPVRFAPRPLGPESLLWRYAGDHRLGLTGLSIGILQLMHPAIGAGVAEHSAFFTEPWERIVRSVPQILGVVYDPDPEATGHRVRDYHRSIKGIDRFGRRYHALEPETFWFAHATFQHAVKQLIDRFDHHRLTRHEREELYLDGVEWYRRYGVSTRPVPADYPSFRAEWQRQCRDVLEMTPAAARALEMALGGTGVEPPFLPFWVKPLQPLVITPLVKLVAIGGLPDAVRRRFGIPWGLDDEAQYRVLQLGVREMWRFVPPSRRYGPTASAGRRAAAADAARSDEPAA
jgi:uncharacterized protein (DUF2236 family)